MKQKIVSVSLNEREYMLFLELKNYYTTDVFQLSNSEVLKIAMLKHLEQMKKEV